MVLAPVMYCKVNIPFNVQQRIDSRVATSLNINVFIAIVLIIDRAVHFAGITIIDSSTQCYHFMNMLMPIIIKGVTVKNTGCTPPDCIADYSVMKI